MEEVIQNIRTLSNPVQGSAYASNPQETFLQAQANLQRFIDEKVDDWEQFFEQLELGEQAPGGAEMRFWIISQALRRIIENHLANMPAEI